MKDWHVEVPIECQCLLEVLHQEDVLQEDVLQEEELPSHDIFVQLEYDHGVGYNVQSVHVEFTCTLSHLL